MPRSVLDLSGVFSRRTFIIYFFFDLVNRFLQNCFTFTRFYDIIEWKSRVIAKNAVWILEKVEGTAMEAQSINNQPKIPSAKLSKILLIISIALGALSPLSGGIFFTLAASVLASISFISLSEKGGKARILLISLLSFVLSTALSVGLTILVDDKLTLTSLTACAFAIVSMIVSLCVFSLKSRTFTEAISAAALSIIAIVGIFCLAVDLLNSADTPDIIGGADIPTALLYLKNMISETFETVMSSFETIGESGESVKIFTEQEIDELVDMMFTYLKLLFPGLLYLFSFVFVHISCGLFRRIMLGYYFGRKHLSDWLLMPSVACAVIFLISSVAVMVCESFLTFSDSNLLTAVVFGMGNVSFITALPCIALGWRYHFLSLKLRRPQAILISAVLIMALCCNPVFLPIFLSIYGAWVRLMSAIAEYRNKNIGQPPQ